MWIDVIMPALSPTMEAGTLAKWLVGVGDLVKSGDVLAEIETDKATMEFEAVDEGLIAELTILEGTDDVPVGTVIARLSAKSETTVAFLPEATSMVPKPEDGTCPPIVIPLPLIPEATLLPAAASPISVSQGSIDVQPNATPLAHKIATAKGISLDTVKGSGLHGRILKADIVPPVVATPIAFSPAEPSVIAEPAIVPPSGSMPYRVIELSRMRGTMARYSTEAKQTVPHFTLTVRCQFDALLALRIRLNNSLSNRGIKLSINDMLIKAMAIAMKQVPETNVQFAGNDMYQFDRIDISMAVATDIGLVTPVIRDVGSLSLSAISRQSQALAARARDDKLVLEEVQGGTASISNIGVFGIDEVVPIIKPPQGLILGIGAGIEQPWKAGSGIDLATIVAASASFDHRVINSKTGARFMNEFRSLIEEPLRIVG
jgi:pyruvate dehydrogenase E2 component (dihydrolipoamide acetyltransferase)